MNDYLILIEPADEHRQGFARWCLAQDPKILTASATGSLVPSALFETIPDPLLDGALIDGHRFRPVVKGLEPDGDGYRPSELPEPVGAPLTASEPPPGPSVHDTSERAPKGPSGTSTSETHGPEIRSVTRGTNAPKKRASRKGTSK